MNANVAVLHRVIAACVRASVPVHIVGTPGVAKTASLTAWGESWGRHVEVVTGASRDKGDYMGMPVEVDGRVVYSPPTWVRNLQNARAGLLVLDELASTSETFGISMRVVQERVVGEAPLPDTVSVIAISNPVEQAVDGADLPAPVANRFVHVDWVFSFDSWFDAALTNFESCDAPDFGEVLCPEYEVASAWVREVMLVGSFLRARPDLQSAVPKDYEAQGKGWPSPRSWTNAMKAMSHLRADDADARLMVLTGAVGQGAATEFLNWAAHADLPDPRAVMRDPNIVNWRKERPDRLFTIVSAVKVFGERGDVKDWEQALAVMVKAAECGKPDVATPAVRRLLAVRPQGAKLPDGTREAFGDLLSRLAGVR